MLLIRVDIQTLDLSKNRLIVQILRTNLRGPTVRILGEQKETIHNEAKVVLSALLE